MGDSARAEHSLSRMMRLLSFCLFAGLALACAPVVDTHAIVFPSGDLSQFETFSFGVAENAPPDFHDSPRTAEVRALAQRLVEGILRSKGFVEKPEGGDFIVQIGCGRREREVQRPIPLPHPLPKRPGWLEEHEEEDLVEGALVIDVLGGKTHEPLWHGAARVEIQPDKVDESLLRRATEKLLDSFPSSHAKVSGTPAAPQ